MTARKDVRVTHKVKRTTLELQSFCLNAAAHIPVSPDSWEPEGEGPRFKPSLDSREALPLKQTNKTCPSFDRLLQFLKAKTVTETVQR